MKTGFSNGLANLLGRLGIGPKAETKVLEQALTAKGAEKNDKTNLLKGAVLANGALLAGLGHTPEDKHAASRNLVERENINRFMQDAPQMKKEAGEPSRHEEKTSAEAFARDGAEIREGKELRDEMRREERADEVRGARVQEEKSEKETRSSHETKEREREREEEQDEQDRPGGAWVEEDLAKDEDETPRRRGALRTEDALGVASRCHGHLPEGGRCLRKPLPGTPYCREHAATSSVR